MGRKLCHFNRLSWGPGEVRLGFSCVKWHCYCLLMCIVSNFSLFLLLTCLFSHSTAWAAKTCQPIDLRNSRTMPERSQFYQHEGTDNESSLCWAFSIANLVGNAVGEAVSVEQFAINERENYYRTSPYTGDQSQILARHLWPMTGGHGSPSLEANFARTSSSSFCSREEFINYRNSLGFTESNWYTAIAQRAEASSREGFVEEINQACINPIQVPQNFRPMFHINKQTSAESIDIRMDGARKLQTRLDRSLESGNPVLFSYEAHVVTIVGRDSDCNYLIQDSIPASIRKTRKVYGDQEYPNHYHDTLSEHIQVWSEEEVLKSLAGRVTSGGRAFGVIGFFEDLENESGISQISEQ